MHQQLYGMLPERFAACYIGKPIQNTENCNVEDELKIIMPLHPHTKQKMEKHKIESSINFIEPQGYLSMLSLLKDSEMVITDSGGLQKESYFARKK